MMEKVKKSWRVVTVKVALCAVVVTFISLFLDWFTYGGLGQSLMNAIKEAPSYFKGFLPLLVVGLLWVAGFFLFNHPKLTLVGDALLLFLYASATLAGHDRGLNTGAGNYLYLVAVIVCILCAFLTRKQRAEKPVA